MLKFLRLIERQLQNAEKSREPPLRQGPDFVKFLQLSLYWELN